MIQPPSLFNICRCDGGENFAVRAQKTRRQESSPAAGGMEPHFCCGYLDQTPDDKGRAGKILREPAERRSENAFTAKRTAPSE
jgi:hypothetical protein